MEMEWRGEGGERVPEGDELGHVNDVGTFRKGLILWEKLNCFFIKLNRLRNHYYFSFFPSPNHSYTPSSFSPGKPEVSFEIVFSFR